MFPNVEKMRNAKDFRDKKAPVAESFRKGAAQAREAIKQDEARKNSKEARIARARDRVNTVLSAQEQDTANAFLGELEKGNVQNGGEVETKE